MNFFTSFNKIYLSIENFSAQFSPFSRWQIFRNTHPYDRTFASPWFSNSENSHNFDNVPVYKGESLYLKLVYYIEL